MAKQLSRERFRQARQFLVAQARPLEGALFAHWFEGAPAAVPLAELAAFQNEDGGFGRALEPDLRTPSSSALATAQGLRLLAELGCAAGHPLVAPALRYLLATCEKGIWRIAPSDTNSHPHAPWWHDEEGSLARAFGQFAVNPRADLVGLLHHFGAGVPAPWLAEITEGAVAAVETGELRGDGYLCALRLAETASLSPSFRARLVPRLRRQVLEVVARDPGQWASYCTPPLWAAPEPGGLVADLLAEPVQQHLDHMIDTQSPEGCWSPFWNWGAFYPGVWEQARREWCGHLTLNALVSLRAYGRLEEQQPARTKPQNEESTR
jgi:hypothetical protein